MIYSDSYSSSVCNDTDVEDIMVYVEKDMELLTLLQYRKEEIVSFYNRLTV